MRDCCLGNIKLHFQPTAWLRILRAQIFYCINWIQFSTSIQFTIQFNSCTEAKKTRSFKLDFHALVILLSRDLLFPISQSSSERLTKRKFHDFLTLTSTENLLTRAGFELAPSGILTWNFLGSTFSEDNSQKWELKHRKFSRIASSRRDCNLAHLNWIKWAQWLNWW